MYEVLTLVKQTFHPQPCHDCYDPIHLGVPVVEVNQASALPVHSLCNIKGGSAS